MKKRLLLLLVLPLVVGALYLRFLASWRPKQVLAVKDPVARFVFSDDGQTLLVLHTPDTLFMLGCAEVTITALDVGHGFQPLWQREFTFFSGRGAQFFDQDSALLIEGYPVQILDSHTGKTRLTYQLLGHAVMSPDGKWLAHHFLGEPSVALNAAKDNRQGSNPIPPQMKLGRPGQIPMQFTFSPNGQSLVVGESDTSGAHLNLYNTKTWKLIRSWIDYKHASPPNMPPITYPFHQPIQWSRDGQFLLSRWQRGNEAVGTSLWRISDGKRLAFSSTRDLTAELQNGGHVLGFSPDGHVFWRKDGNLNSWGKPLLYLPREDISAATLSPDGSYLVAGTQSGRVFWKRVQ